MPRYPVTVTVKEMKEEFPPPCPIHQIGDTLTLGNGSVEGRVCLYFLVQHLPRIYALSGGVPSRLGDVLTIACPDKGKVVFEVRRDSSHCWKDALFPLAPAEFIPPQI